MADAATPAYDWLHFAARSGEAGASWAAEYRRSAPVVALSDRALLLLRQRRIGEGEDALREYARAVERMRPRSRSLGRVLERWLYGVSAFHLYCIGEMDAAADAMDRAHEAVVDALTEDRFLLMLAIHCQEFRLHHARIARNRLQWNELEAHVRVAREMTEDRVALCELGSGEPVFFDTIGRFVGEVPDACEGEREFAREIRDRDRRSHLFEQFVRRLYALPDFAIRYP